MTGLSSWRHRCGSTEEIWPIKRFQVFGSLSPRNISIKRQLSPPMRVAGVYRRALDRVGGLSSLNVAVNPRVPDHVGGLSRLQLRVAANPRAQDRVGGPSRSRLHLRAAANPHAPDLVGGHSLLPAVADRRVPARVGRPHRHRQRHRLRRRRSSWSPKT